jgi:aldose 1-epimerase
MVETRVVGRYRDRQVVEAVLETGEVRVAILSWGCTVRDWRVAGRPVCLGFDRFEEYPDHSPYFGAVAGRVANRIAGGRFRLGGQDYRLACNDGPNHLHGGPDGIGRRVWDAEADSARNAVRFRYFSPDGEEGYPGAVRFAVTYRLDGHALHCTLEGVPDRPTPINLAQHNYYNLAGAGDIRGHSLRIDADHYLPVDAGLIPTGEIAPVAGTRFDFRTPRIYAEADPDRQGHDHNYVLRPGRDPAAPAAELAAAGLRLRLRTDRPGLQLYTAARLGPAVPGLDGRRYGAFGGLCLEAQGFPDAINRPDWPGIVHTPEAPYFQRLVIEIAPEG